MNQPEKSDIELNIEIIKEDTYHFPEEESLQRNESWREDRRGRWTASQMKNLQSCGQSGARMSWNSKEKVYNFGVSSLKYIYENAMERKTGRYIDSGVGTKQMKFGTIVEPLIYKAANEKFKSKGVLRLVGFKSFPGIPEAGVSSDAILQTHEDKILATVESKGCTNWSTHFSRTFDLMDEKSLDFWQTQAQMIAWEVDTCYYIVCEPPKDINKYVYYDGDIMDLYDDFCKECPISIQELKASPMHQESLIKRINIGEETINYWLKNGGNLREILYTIIEKHRESSVEKTKIPNVPKNRIIKNSSPKIEIKNSLISQEELMEIVKEREKRRIPKTEPSDRVQLNEGIKPINKKKKSKVPKMPENKPF